MTLEVLQSSFARAVTGSHGGVERQALSESERRSCDAVEQDPGLDIVRTLYRSWRLTKVMSLLPMTTAEIPTDELARLLTEFWRSRFAVGPYFVEECLAFLDFLSEQDAVRSDRMLDLTTFERVRLELHQEVGAGSLVAERMVPLINRPSDLFARTIRNETHRPVAASSVRGRVEADGEEQWLVVAGPDAGTQLSVGSVAH